MRSKEDSANGIDTALPSCSVMRHSFSMESFFSVVKMPAVSGARIVERSARIRGATPLKAKTLMPHHRERR